MQAVRRQIEYFEDERGRFPAHEWLDALKDKMTRVIIKGRIRRLEAGNFGHTRSLGEGIIELKIDYGPGFRVYLGLEGNSLVVILVIGDKSSQSKDINLAKARWKDHQERKV